MATSLWETLPRKVPEFSPVDSNIRKDEVGDANLAPLSVVICDDVVRNEEMVHPAAEEGAGVAMIVLLKAQKVNAAMYTVHIYKPIEGIIDFKRFFIVIQYSYLFFQCS